MFIYLCISDNSVVAAHLSGEQDDGQLGGGVEGDLLHCGLLRVPVQGPGGVQARSCRQLADAQCLCHRQHKALQPPSHAQAALCKLAHCRDCDAPVCFKPQNGLFLCVTGQAINGPGNNVTRGAPQEHHPG